MQIVRVLSLLAAVMNIALPSVAQSLYTADGTPTGLEEEIRWRVNRGRFDSASENATRGTAYADIPASSGPLAPNQLITLAARHQSEDMAKANLFQHATVPSSLFYNAVTQPNPWDRMSAEGYSWNNAGENIAAGYSGAESVYVGWWNSTGHRVNMYSSALREIGNGYYNFSTSTYRQYYTMDLGTSGGICFFTDTLFNDANGNGIYEQSEAVAGVTILLQTASGQAAWYDVSAAAGSFAIPIQSIASSTTVQVLFSNTTSQTLTLTIPQDYRNYSTVTLAPNESRTYGTFVRPSTARNIGFRNVTAAQVSVTPIVAPPLNISATGNNIVLRWTSDPAYEYQPQWSTNMIEWTGLAPNFLRGTGGPMTYTDPIPEGGRRMYRLQIRRP
jgi:hypothetical protein